MLTTISKIQYIIIYYWYVLYVVTILLGLEYEMVWSWVRSGRSFGTKWYAWGWHKALHPYSVIYVPC